MRLITDSGLTIAVFSSDDCGYVVILCTSNFLKIGIQTAGQFLNPVSENLKKLPQMPASKFLKRIGRNWPNPVCSFYLPVSISRIATVLLPSAIYGQTLCVKRCHASSIDYTGASLPFSPGRWPARLRDSELAYLCKSLIKLSLFRG